MFLLSLLMLAARVTLDRFLSNETTDATGDTA